MKTTFSRKTKSCYYPYEAVSKYLEKELLLAKKKRGLIPAGDGLDREADELNSRNLDKEKNEILNRYIFPSMANIIKFLEYSQMEELRDVFTEDIKELFFGKSWIKEKSGFPDYPVFMRFLLAALAWKPEIQVKNFDNSMRMDQKANLTDFRLELINYIYKALETLAIFYGPRYVFDNDSYAKVVMQDFVRLGIWIRLLTKDADVKEFDTREVSRRVLF